MDDDSNEPTSLFFIEMNQELEFDKSMAADFFKPYSPKIYVYKTTETTRVFIQLSEQIEHSKAMEFCNLIQSDPEPFLMSVDDKITDFEKITYMTNYPKELKENIFNFANSFDNRVITEEIIKDCLIRISMPTPNAFSVFAPFLTYGSTITTNYRPLDVPLLEVSNLPSNFSKKNFSLFNCPQEFINCSFTPLLYNKKAFLLFENNEDALDAMKYFNFARINNTEIECSHFTDNEKDYQQWEIKVENINPYATSFDLWSRFQEYGVLLSAKIKKNGSGIVQYFDKRSANNAIKAIKKQETTLHVCFSNEM